MKKAALKWFNSLPSISICKFSDLQSCFLAHFTTRKFKPKLVTSLLGLSQQQGEPLWDFLERFNAETMLVEELETQAVVLTLLNGLRPGAFKDSLSKRPAKTMDKIQVRAEKYIYLEETQRATASSIKNQAEKKPGPQYEEHQKKELRAPRVRRFHDYTPLSVYLADLYREVGQVEIFPKPKAIRVRANTNKSLFYEYHNSFGHKTENCYNLQDAVEQFEKKGWRGTLPLNGVQGKEGLRL